MDSFRPSETDAPNAVATPSSTSKQASLWVQKLIQTSFAAHDPFETLATDLVDDPETANALAAEIDALLRQVLPRHEHAGDCYNRRLALDLQGRVLSLSPSARTDWGLEAGMGLDALGLTQGEFDTCLRRARNGQALTLIRPPKVDSDGDDGFSEEVLVSVDWSAGTEQIIMQAAELPWPEPLDSMLVDLFNLTASERDIARDIMAGLDASRIAQRRGRALGTVRQQIKSVQGKTRCHSQLRLQALLAQAAFALRRPDPGTDLVADLVRLKAPMAATDPRNGLAPAKSLLHVPKGSRARPTRQVPVRMYGDPTGLPCLVFHGCLFGLGEHIPSRKAAALLGLQVFGPERPGFGQNVGLAPEAPWQDHATVGVDDALAAMQMRGVSRVVVVAQDTGLMPALAFARACPQHVAGLVCVSPTPPIRTWAQTEGMPAQQRVFALAMLRMPRLAESLVQLGLGRMRKIGAQAWPEAVFAGVPHDESVARLPVNLETVMRAYLFNSANNATGFRIDLHNQYRDWSELLADTKCPVTVLHGALNRTTSVTLAREFFATLPSCSFHIVPDAGHTLSLSHYPLVLREVVRQWMQADTSRQ